MEKKYYKYKMNMMTLNVLCILLFVVVFLITFLINPSIEFNLGLREILLIIFWFMLHELLHYVGFYLNSGVKAKNLVLGAELEKGIFYCMCKQEISKKAIIQALLFPLVIIGILTWIIGMINSSGLLVMLSLLNISGAIGDIVMVIFLLKCPKDIKYIDLDDTTSFYIISSSDLSKIKVLGLRLDESGIYDKDRIYPKNFKKITITKTSIIILILFIIIFAII